MNLLERALVAVLLALAMIVGGIFWAREYGAERYDAGYAAAVAAGKAQYDRAAAAAHQTESDLRAQLAVREADAIKKEQKYASNLEAAQRRVLTGVDRLRCPAAGPLPTATATGDRPAAGAPAADGPGSELVPEAAADVLGIGAAIASLVRRYDEVVDEREICRTVNAK